MSTSGDARPVHQDLSSFDCLGNTEAQSSIADD